jgi:hypothetical protein
MTDKTKYWLDKQDRYHRKNGPAIIKPNGNEFWFKHGKLHRLDGPAIITELEQNWYYYGKLHRRDAPAVNVENEITEWWKYGLLHCEIGPAVDPVKGIPEWYINGIKLSFIEWKEWFHKYYKGEITSKITYNILKYN